MSGGSRVAPWLTAAQFASGLDVPEPPVPVPPPEPPKLKLPALPSGVWTPPSAVDWSGLKVQPVTTRPTPTTRRRAKREMDQRRTMRDADREDILYRPLIGLCRSRLSSR